MTVRESHPDGCARRHAGAVLAWQGWRVDLPREWNPVRIEGDWRAGFLLVADLHRPRLGIRWGTIREKRFDPNDWARRAIRAEIGQLAAREARPLAPTTASTWRGGLLYVDPHPPGRDVWVAASDVSGRAIELIYHAERRDATLAERVVPAVQDLPPGGPMPWSVFDLRCTSPAGMRVKSHRLAPGDLGLDFADEGGGRRRASIRQISVAKLALSRMPLAAWLRTDQRRCARTHRSVEEMRDVSMSLDDGRELAGLEQTLRRRSHLAFLRSAPPAMISLALHDARRDKLILAQGSDETLVRDMIRSTGASDR